MGKSSIRAVVDDTPAMSRETRGQPQAMSTHKRSGMRNIPPSLISQG